VQLDEMDTAREYYRIALEEFPDSDLAKSGLEYVEPEESK
jgi:hypothetical protein